jgi:uncharacterized protein (TIGR03118 family)
MRLRNVLLVGGITLAIALVAVPARAQFYEQHNLVTDSADSNLINPWGLVSSATSPWWVADNGTAKSTLYNGQGVPFPPPPNGPLIVSVQGAPTGIVFNIDNDPLMFNINASGKTGRAVFMFDSEDGTISAWNPSGDPTQAAVVYTSPDGAIYKGLAIASTAAGPRLYATNFNAATVEVFDGTFTPIVPGGFEDPTIPSGFAPFGIQTIGDVVYVTYAMQDEDKEDDVAGKGLGFVNAFDTAGNLLGRVASQGQLNAPWGIAWAPDDFGKFSGHLLIGNFGDGRILAFNPEQQLGNGRYQYKGFLHSTSGAPLSIEGLWALQFGHGNANSGDTNALFFTAGPDDEEGGLFGFLKPAEHPGGSN